jgi:hypothetical protein
MASILIELMNQLNAILFELNTADYVLINYNQKVCAISIALKNTYQGDKLKMLSRTKKARICDLLPMLFVFLFDCFLTNGAILLRI